MNKTEIKAIETLRVLAMEEITKANSGHPGIALGAAPLIHALYAHVMNYNVNNPAWVNRDRFVMAAGHGSSLVYAMLHLAGFNVSSNDLASFRQLDSITPGHPEVGETSGVDASSGPLGQGLPTAVGMAIAEENLRARLGGINHYTYCLCSDAELQEGVSSEAISLAGHLKLNRLIVLMDSNDIQLDGRVDDSFTENVKLKMEAAEWNYLRLEDGNDVDALVNLIEEAKLQDKPTFIECRTVIGYGSSLAGSNKCHGNPLTQEEVSQMRAHLGGEAFSVDSDVVSFYNEVRNRNLIKFNEWLKNNPNFTYPRESVDYSSLVDKSIDGKATRTIAGKVIEALTTKTSFMIGGSADLIASCKVKGGNGNFNKDNRSGQNLMFGVREHAMAAICNGIALHGGLTPICGGFFVFSDYAKPAIRMSAIQNLGVIYCFSHDSIAVGEDGPTHEPVEQITGLRAIPNLNVIRPANLNETIEAFKIALESQNRPTFIVTTRQDLEPIDIQSNVSKGAYIVYDQKKVDGIIIASGSEVCLALKSAKALEEEGICVRVVSMPSVNLFEEQSAEYKEMVLPSNIRKRLAIEMDDATHMYKYVGLDGLVKSINTFGKSGKAKEVIHYFGYETDEIVRLFKELK